MGQKSQTGWKQNGTNYSEFEGALSQIFIRVLLTEQLSKLLGYYSYYSVVQLVKMVRSAPAAYLGR